MLTPKDLRAKKTSPARLSHLPRTVEQANPSSVTILPSITASFTGDLGDVNLSGLYGSDVPTSTSAASSGPLSVVVITGAPAPTSAPATDTVVPTNSAGNSSSAAVGKSAGPVILSTGAIVGIVVGGVVALILLIVILRRCTSRKPKKFDRGRGITPSMVISPRGSFTPGPNVKQYNQHPNQTNNNSDRNHLDIPQSPVIHPPVIVVDKERRFSKYNLLNQALRRPDSDASAYSTFRTPSPTHKHQPYQYF
ncbi:hypothetical protein BX666DRAFT_1935484 [Dichotomocladium elegans]|nr:hypothetical protein BX666DRAFT_1935484 [Dichotomocladium elegans]